MLACERKTMISRCGLLATLPCNTTGLANLIYKANKHILEVFIQWKISCELYIVARVS